MAILLSNGSSMLHPGVEARMVLAMSLQLESKVLDIGIGSGYSYVILSRLCKQVYTMKIDPEQKTWAEKVLEDQAIENVTILDGDGLNGYAAQAPYDGIFVGGALSDIPETLSQ